ncbi:hypothetical protein L873DRAFT_1796842 [Choiromyces venosus 120613-1]|uniref:Uncharacterized protein n=1 Tax=Choiromyces venosus 120613-1 TaxID=1336337 RepID=A0A3N4KC30_9PEZI|nr:hypothetical protein L873DRAFT_1796842 [Choiromyces venosus 120613-1]
MVIPPPSTEILQWRRDTRGISDRRSSLQGISDRRLGPQEIPQRRRDTQQIPQRRQDTQGISDRRPGPQEVLVSAVVGGSNNTIFGNSNTNCGNVTKTVNKNISIVAADKRNQILDWLSPLKPQERHSDVSALRLDGVGTGVLKTPEFAEWRNGEDGSAKPVLFCSGDPGVGKTYLW